MNPILQASALVVATIFAGAAAVAFDWLLLRAMFRLMQPAVARRREPASQLVRGTARLAQAFAAHK